MRLQLVAYDQLEAGARLRIASPQEDLGLSLLRSQDRR